MGMRTTERYDSLVVVVVVVLTFDFALFVRSGVQTKRERLLSRHERGGVERNREENVKNNGESLGRLLGELSSLSSSFI